MPCPVALTLVDYWAQCPPTHLILKAIGKQLGIETRSTEDRKQLTTAEEWAEAGYDASTGAKVNVVALDKVPLTVREFIKQLAKDKPNA